MRQLAGGGGYKNGVTMLTEAVMEVDVQRSWRISGVPTEILEYDFCKK